MFFIFFNISTVHAAWILISPLDTVVVEWSGGLNSPLNSTELHRTPWGRGGVPVGCQAWSWRGECVECLWRVAGRWSLLVLHGGVA